MHLRLLTWNRLSLSTSTFWAAKLGGSHRSWIDFDFFGNQLSAHASGDTIALDYCGSVDGVSVPSPHFGCVLSMDDFELIRQRLQDSGMRFIVRSGDRTAE